MPLRFFMHNFVTIRFGRSDSSALLLSLLACSLSLPGCTLHSALSQAFPRAIGRFIRYIYAYIAKIRKIESCG